MKEGEQPQKVAITIRTQDKNNNDKFISINGGINEMAVSPNGKEIAFIARGEVFVTSVGESFTKRLTNTPEQERFVTWDPEGESIVYSSERNGKWSIYKTEKTRKEEPFFYAATLVRSPDSKWLLVDWSLSLNNTEVLLMAADGSKRVNLNESGYYDSSPKWVNEGKQMIWFSNKNGLKSYATSGRSESDVYSMFFTQEAWDKYSLSDEDYKLQKAIEEVEKEEKEKAEKAKKKAKEAAEKNTKKKGKKKDKDSSDKADDKDKKEDKDKDLTFDWENMKDRTSRMTIHSSRLGDAVLSKDGEKLYYLSQFEKGMNLWSTNLRTKETKMVLKLGANFGRLEWDKDRKNLFLLSSGKISKIDPEKAKKEAVKIKGEMEFDAAAERQAMFDHVWIRTNAIFYHSNFHGIDWNQMKTEYEKYIPHLGNSFEVTEMLSEMLGELNVSHAGARYGGNKVANADATASLGIFMNYDHTGDGILIDEIIKGGPLDKAKIKAKAGMIIEKIDGETIDQNQDVAKYLNRKAGDFTLLEIVDPATKKREMVRVKPITLRAENRLLYKRWVKINEKEEIF